MTDFLPLALPFQPCSAKITGGDRGRFSRPARPRAFHELLVENEAREMNPRGRGGGRRKARETRSGGKEGRRRRGWSEKEEASAMNCRAFVGRCFEGDENKRRNCWINRWKGIENGMFKMFVIMSNFVEYVFVISFI